MLDAHLVQRFRIVMAAAEFTDYVTVFYYGTFLPVANGGNTRLAELLDRLDGEFERVLLYCYGNHPHAPWTHEAATAFRARWPAGGGRAASAGCVSARSVMRALLGTRRRERIDGGWRRRR